MSSRSGWNGFHPAPPCHFTRTAGRRTMFEVVKVQLPVFSARHLLSKNYKHVIYTSTGATAAARHKHLQPHTAARRLIGVPQAPVSSVALPSAAFEFGGWEAGRDGERRTSPAGEARELVVWPLITHHLPNGEWKRNIWFLLW